MRVSISCRRASASRRPCGTSAPRTRVYQNIDIIESYEPALHGHPAGDHVYKMDYEKMLQQHVEVGRGCHGRLHRVPRLGGDRLRRDACRRRRTHHRISSRSRRTRRRCRASPTWRSPAWAFTFSRLVPDRSPGAGRRRSGLRAAILARTSSPTSSSPARRSRTISPSPASAPTTRRKPTGAMSGPSTPTGKPTST